MRNANVRHNNFSNLPRTFVNKKSFLEKTERYRGLGLDTNAVNFSGRCIQSLGNID